MLNRQGTTAGGCNCLFDRHHGIGDAGYSERPIIGPTICTAELYRHPFGKAFGKERAAGLRRGFINRVKRHTTPCIVGTMTAPAVSVFLRPNPIVDDAVVCGGCIIP